MIKFYQNQKKGRNSFFTTFSLLASALLESLQLENTIAASIKKNIFKFQDLKT